MVALLVLLPPTRPRTVPAAQLRQRFADLAELLAQDLEVLHDRDHVLGPGRALQPHGALHELLGVDHTVTVVEHLEQLGRLFRVQLQCRQERLHQRVREKLLELLQGQNAVSCSIRCDEEFQQLVSIALLLCQFLLDHQLCITAADCKCVLQEQAGDDPRHREHNKTNVKAADESKHDVEIYQGGDIDGPRASESDLKDCPR
mmetsp:Transcript_102582/g.257075  ORF Transcript_102582/g.257075 Transcript_102582/m.257075 type:complete len:202 (+) Transcript_102582:235-840(+)